MKSTRVQISPCQVSVEVNMDQGRSQPHSPGWARVPFSSFFPEISINFSYFSSNFYSFSSSFWPSGWASRPHGKALAMPLIWIDLRPSFFHINTLKKRSQIETYFITHITRYSSIDQKGKTNRQTNKQNKTIGRYIWCKRGTFDSDCLLPCNTFVL